VVRAADQPDAVQKNPSLKRSVHGRIKIKNQNKESK